MKFVMNWCSRLIKKLDQLKPLDVAIIISVIALAVFFSGLQGGFQGDDTDQIIKNEAVHSLSNIGKFFGSSTFWNGEELVGDFYRPMMTTTYAFVYAFFGANPTAYHAVQLMLYIGCAFMLYLFLKSIFKPSVALLLSLIFLAHPINSQPVFSIPSMQEPLMLLFGISSLYVLSKFKETKHLIFATALLFLSLMSKETAIVFVCLAVLYMFIFHRQQTVLFIKIVSIPVVLFILMRIGAVGFRNIVQSAPVDMLSFGERMIMVPSMIMFYVIKFIFPYDLATSYYWVYKSVTVTGFWLPLLFDLAIAAGFIYAGRLIYKKNNKKSFNYYLFFAAWAILGLMPHLQIIALDMTACETWFIIPIIGFLGMLTLIATSLLPRIKPCWLLIIFVPLLIVLGVRTAIRGLDYHSQVTLSLKDIAVTDKNYLAMNNLAKYYIDHGDPKKGEGYAIKSIEYFPAISNHINLGVARQVQRDYKGAKQAYMQALEFYPLRVTYENIAIVNFSIGESADNIAFLKEALKVFFDDNRLWNYLAIEEAAAGNEKEAKNAILNAYRTGSVPTALYDAIMNKKPLDIPMPGSDRTIHIKWD